MNKKYIVGIDLGTTNSVLAYSLLGTDSPEIQLLEIPQLVSSNTIESRQSLASFTYLATESQSNDDAFALPWAANQQHVVGEIARLRSAETPDRTVVAAKSWLCHHEVDRRQPILPWDSTTTDVHKISPVTASQRYLEHLVAAWEHQFPDAPLGEQNVVLTVPASFDPVARELTREAAIAAGLPGDFVLLEEPQAALYAWLESTGDAWRKQLSVGQSVLVCDIGGGTTDLTLISVEEEDGELSLRREAVGDHLLVGGDNMDLALAHHVSQSFAKQGTKLNPWQSVSLWHSCRSAKETLLAADGPDAQSISVLGRGSKLIGGTVTTEIKREEIASLLIDGFLPVCKLHDRPQNQARSGFQEIGLPFESDPGITRHIASFVETHCGADKDMAMPDFVLLNGGVFKAAGFSNRLIETIGTWNSKSTPRLLDGVHDLDHAVARGACHYGWSKEHGGTRIRGGVANSYYVGIETAGLAIPGAPRPLKALCVVPFGMEEGSEVDVPSSEFGLVLGQQARFRFFRSNTRKDDQPGALLDAWTEDELDETDPLETTLVLPEGVDQNHVPVKFHSRVTELGMFELWCKAVNQEGDWKLEFNVREEEV